MDIAINKTTVKSMDVLVNFNSSKKAIFNLYRDTIHGTEFVKISRMELSHSSINPEESSKFEEPEKGCSLLFQFSLLEEEFQDFYVDHSKEFGDLSNEVVLKHFYDIKAYLVLSDALVKDIENRIVYLASESPEHAGKEAEYALMARYVNYDNLVYIGPAYPYLNGEKEVTFSNPQVIKQSFAGIDDNIEDQFLPTICLHVKDTGKTERIGEDVGLFSSYTKHVDLSQSFKLCKQYH